MVTLKERLNRIGQSVYMSCHGDKHTYIYIYTADTLGKHYKSLLALSPLGRYNTDHMTCMD